jgi:hypothetical protein
LKYKKGMIKHVDKISMKEIMEKCN